MNTRALLSVVAASAIILAFLFKSFCTMVSLNEVVNLVQKIGADMPFSFSNYRVF